MDQKRTLIKKIAPFTALGFCILDSFLLDPFLLFIIGLMLTWVEVRMFLKRGTSYLMPLSFLTLFLFWSISISLFFNLSWVHWIARLCHAQNGRDWMLNSGVFHFNIESPSELTLVISGFLFALYPLWLWLGIQCGYILFGRKATHRGVISLFSLRPNPKP